MNIFETIGKATSRIERFHSQFLADALCESLKGNRSLFDQVWTLVAPSGWEIPERSDQVRVIPEQGVEGGRVDICIHCFAPQDRVIGIEIKTVEDSSEPGQLERYRAGLKKNSGGPRYRLLTLRLSTRNTLERGPTHSQLLWSSNDSND